MWQDIINTAKSTLSGRVQNGVGTNPYQAEDSVQLAGESTRDVLMQEVKQGNVDGLISLFRGEDETSTSHPLTLKITNVLHGKLVDQVGLNPDDAKEVEHATVPYILKQVNERISGDESGPSAKNLDALFGGPGAMSEGMKDKLIRGLDRF